MRLARSPFRSSLFRALRAGSSTLRQAFLVAALFLAAAPAPGQQIKIGFIDTARLQNESVQGRRIVETLKREFQPREQEIVALQKEIAEERARFDAERDTLERSVLTERGKAIAAKMKQSDRMVFALKEDIERRRKELAANFERAANDAIAFVAKDGQFDLILREATFRSARIDITDQVISEMAKRAGAGGP